MRAELRAPASKGPMDFPAAVEALRRAHAKEAPQPLPFTKDDPRLSVLSDRPVRPSGDYVLYFCQIYRRAEDNAALAYAVELANALAKPVLFYEAVRPDYPHASDRFHTFLLEGAQDTATRLADMGILHAFFLPRTAEEARGVVARLMARACAVVADAFPSFTIPQQNAAAAAKAPCRYVVVDDCAGLPLALFPKQEFAARTLRPKVARAMADWLRPVAVPAPRVEARALDLPFDPVRWSSASIGELVARCAIDHEVGPVRSTVGGSSRAEGLLERFVAYKLPAYASDRNDPTRDIGSSLSPYLHFGMISARRVAVEAIAGGIRRKLPDGALAGFLEQLLVRRGLAYNFAARQPRHADYEALPAWAIETLETHRKDVRPWLGTARELEAAKTPDALWNACQWELRLRGTIQSYARMLWGKLPIQWMADPREAHRVLVYLNDKYALDGRDPDGYASVSWCFGLHDRPWPVHACFGKVRTMTSKSARSKFDFDSYIRAMADLRASSD